MIRMDIAALLVPLSLALGTAATAGTEEIRLATNEVLSVELLEITHDSVRFVHPILGELTVARDQVTLPGDDAQDAAADPEASSEAAEPAAPENETAAAPAEPKKRDWKSNFILGASYVTGNTETADLTVAVRSVRETKRTRTALDASYYYAENRADTTDTKVTAGVLQDWYIVNTPWLFFGSARYDFDDFQSWRHRVGLHGGLGYRLFDEADFRLTLRGGAGAIREWGSDNDGIQPEALLGFNGTWQITDRQSLVFDTYLYPNLDDTGEYRAVSNVAWSWLMEQQANMSLTLGLRNEYQSLVDPGNDRNDLRLVAGLQFDF